MENINRWLRVVVALLTIILAGCAITQMTSQVNTELRGRSFSKVLVHGNFQNLKHRQLAEDKLCTDLTRIAGCKCLRSSKVFFPGQEYSAEQIANRLTELEIDGILTLQPTGKGTSSTYIPQITHTTGSATVIGNTVKGSSTTRTSGGYNISKPWANYEVILWSITDGKVAWYATAESGGNAFAGWDDLIRSASSKAVSKLVSDGALMFREQKASNLSLALTPEAEMAEVKKVYLRGEYDKAIQKLQNLMIFVKQVELIENQHEMLANAFLLLGSCYLKKG